MANELHDNPEGFTAEQALERLKQGNARFVAGESHSRRSKLKFLPLWPRGSNPMPPF